MRTHTQAHVPKTRLTVSIRQHCAPNPIIAGYHGHIEPSASYAMVRAVLGIDINNKFQQCKQCMDFVSLLYIYFFQGVGVPPSLLIPNILKKSIALNALFQN